MEEEGGNFDHMVPGGLGQAGTELHPSPQLAQLTNENTDNGSYDDDTGAHSVADPRSGAVEDSASDNLGPTAPGGLVSGSPAFLTNSNKTHVHHEDVHAGSVSEQGSDMEGISARPGRGMGTRKCHACMYSSPSPGSASPSHLQTEAGRWKWRHITLF